MAILQFSLYHLDNLKLVFASITISYHLLHDRVGSNTYEVVNGDLGGKLFL